MSDLERGRNDKRQEIILVGMFCISSRSPFCFDNTSIIQDYLQLVFLVLHDYLIYRNGSGTQS